MAGDIVVGYDGSEGSQAALRVAVSVAKAFDAPLTVVFGYEPNPMGGETADYKNQLEKIGKGHLGQAVAEAKAIDPTVGVEPIVAALRPVESLLEASLDARRGSSWWGERGAAHRGCDPRLGAAQAAAPLDGARARGARPPRTEYTADQAERLDPRYSGFDGGGGVTTALAFALAAEVLLLGCAAAAGILHWSRRRRRLEEQFAAAQVEARRIAHNTRILDADRGRAVRARPGALARDLARPRRPAAVARRARPTLS